MALALAVPVLVCITKVDMTPPHILEATVKQLTKILRSPGCRKTPVFVENIEQAVDSALRLGSERICPVFQISNVTGQNLGLLRSFLNVLPQADLAKVRGGARQEERRALTILSCSYCSFHPRHRSSFSCRTSFPSHLWGVWSAG